MLRDVAIARIQRGLGFRTDQYDNIVLALQEAQRLLERGRTLPYFLLNEGVSLLTAIGDREYDLPVRFLREDAEYGLRLVTGVATEYYLEKVTHREKWIAFQTVEDTGKPLAYTLRKDRIEIAPTPDAVYPLVWSYYVGALPLTSNIENAWLEEEYGAPEVLIARAGMLMADDLYNQVAKAKFQQIFSEAYAGMLGDTFQRAEENDPLYMGGRL